MNNTNEISLDLKHLKAIANYNDAMKNWDDTPMTEETNLKFLEIIKYQKVNSDTLSDENQFAISKLVKMVKDNYDSEVKILGIFMTIDTKEFDNASKEHKIKIVFVASQFSQKSAKIIANSINGNVEVINPLSYKWSENLVQTAQKIANTYK